MAIYAKIERYKEENAKALTAKAAEVAHTPDHPTAAVNAAAGKQNPLEQVLTFCAGGVEVDSIKEYIESPDFTADAKATNYKFNFAQDSVRLHDTCKQNAALLQHLMRAHLSPAVASAHK
jgi:2-keto-3-deoxy-6-phosphogluconate aldolase